MQELNQAKSLISEDIDKTRKAVKAKEELVGMVLKELGSLPQLADNRASVEELLGVRVKSLSNFPPPPISIIEEWALVYEEFLCVSLLVDNQTKFHGYLNS